MLYTFSFENFMQHLHSHKSMHDATHTQTKFHSSKRTFRVKVQKYDYVFCEREHHEMKMANIKAFFYVV